MAVSFLTAAQRDRYGRYPDVVTPNDLSRCFHLSDDDRAQIRAVAATTIAWALRCS
jgi:hypothetical protein